MKKNEFLIIAPYPQKSGRIFSKEDIAYLDTLVTVKDLGDEGLDYDEIDALLPNTVAIIGQFDLPKERLELAPKLKVIFNAEGNFAQNVDYDYCHAHSIHVLNCGEAFALPVAEIAIGFALDLARQITKTDKDFRAKKEGYLAEACTKSLLLTGARVGFIGFGTVGKFLIKFLAPFRCKVHIYDPWIPERVIEDHGGVASSLEDVLSNSQFIFVLAGVTAENQGMLNREKLSLIDKNAFFLLLSRAAIVNFDDLVALLSENAFTAAIDVFPVEPLEKDHPIRSLDNVVLSSHRAGALPQAYKRIGEMITDDLKLILRGLPPVVMQVAKRETVSRFRNKPSA